MSLAAQVDALERFARAAERQLRREGWYQFGAHADRPDLKLEFSEELDECGLPVFERVVLRVKAQES